MVPELIGSPAEPTRIARDTESAIPIIYLAVLCVLLMAAVLTFGAVDLWATSILEASAVLLLVGWIAFGKRFALEHVKWSPLYPPMLIFSAVVCAQIVFNLSVYRYATLLAALQCVAYFALFIVTLQVTGDERSSKFLLLTLGIFGFLVAIFAICQNLIAPGRLYWAGRRRGSAVFGPYVNHNHYAGLMEMLTPLPLVLSLSKLENGSLRILAAFATVFMAGSIILSGSRSGTFGLLIEIAFLFWTARQVRRRAGLRYSLVALLLCLLAFLGWLGSADLWHHFGDLRDAIRPAILKDGLAMVRLKPIVGWGLGTFPTAYPAYRSFYTNLFVNAAHNDYLQILIETGAAGFVMCRYGSSPVFYFQALKQIGNWTHRWDSALRIAAITGCTGLLIHSASDFNLQIPANAALFCVLCAISIKPRSRTDFRSSSPNHLPKLICRNSHIQDSKSI